VTEPRLPRALPFIILCAGTAAIFLIGLGRLPLFGRDEALYAESGREMLATGDWITPQVNGGPFFEKPPLYYWLAAASYRAFGVTPFAARLPAALMAILTVVLVAQIGARVWGRRAGLLAGLALATCLQMAMIGRMGIMDVPLTCLTVLAVLAYERWRCGNGLAGAALFGICLGSAVLLKGAAGLVPLGVAAADSLVRVLLKERLGRPVAVSALTLLLAAGIAAALASPWFIIMSSRHGAAFGSTLFLHEHLRRVLQPMQGHGGPLWIYLPLIAVSFFPWVVFLPPAVVCSDEGSDQARSWRVLCIVWIAVVLIPFSLISTKLPGYVTPLFPPMALLVGAELAQGGRRRSWVALLIGALVLGALAALLPAAAAKMGQRVGASDEARLLTAPALIWVAGYLVIAFAAAAVLLCRFRNPVEMLVLGQVAAMVALLFGVLPVLSPYLGGGSSGLAELARRELPASRIVLYQTHPENVNFVLQRPVPTYDQHQQQQLVDQLRTAPTALIAPAKDSAFWSSLPARHTWRLGDSVLLDIPKMSYRPEASP